MSEFMKEEKIRKKSTQINSQPFLLAKVIKIQRAWRIHTVRKQFKKVIQRKRNRQYLIKELLDSEQCYCDNLAKLVNEVVIPSKEVIDDQQLHQLLFCNLQEIYHMHSHFLQKLKAALQIYNHFATKFSSLIYDQLFNRNDFNSKYSYYCANYRKSNQISKLLLANNSGLRTLLSKLNLHESSALDSELIKPMQRLCKYELILSKFHKNTEKDHCDYEELDVVMGFVEKMVKQTNDQVEEFLLDEKLRDIKYKYEKEVLNKIPNKERKLLYFLEDVSLIDMINDTSTVTKEILLFNDSIMVIPLNSKPIFTKLRIYRDLPNLKYFKNLIQLINEDKYLTISLKKEKQKEQFILYLNKTVINNKDNTFVTVSILGTETRQSLFKNFTVYIAEVSFGCSVKAIYPRFKDMIKVQDFIDSKKIRLQLPSLNKETLFMTSKSKTIEKRKLVIQEFLQKVLNCADCYHFTQIFKILKLELKEKDHRNEDELTIFLPSMQIVKVMMDVKSGTISDLKRAIADNLGLEYCTQFEIFELRGKDRRLLYDNESVSQIHSEQKSFSFNLFKESITYIYTRHHYLQPEEQFQMYKNDFVRIELELSVIKAEIKLYRLEEELMITYMCLFAMYINLSIMDDSKLTSFIKDLGKKMYKISNAEFRAYFEQVEKRVEAEEDELVTLPFLIIKIISNAPLYQCQQFDVQVHPKSFKAIKSYMPGLEEKLTLGIRSTHIMLLTVQEKHTIQSIPMQCVEIAQLHPTALILQFEDIGPTLRLNTQNAYEISRLFEIYKNKKPLMQ